MSRRRKTWCAVFVLGTCVGGGGRTFAGGWPPWAEVPELRVIAARYGRSDAVVVRDDWSITLKGGERSGERRRIVLVLTADGRGEASIALYRGSFHQFSRVKAWVRQPSGRVLSFDDQDGTLFSTSSERLLDDTEVLLLRPRGVGPGCLVALQYRFTEKADIPHDLFHIEEDIPVFQKTVRVDTRGGWRVEAQVAPGPIPGPSSTTGEGAWGFSGLPARAPGKQPFSPQPPRIKLALHYLPPGGDSPFRDWNALARWGAALYRLTEGDLAPLDPAISAVRESPGDGIEEAGKLARRLRYYAVEIGWGGFVPRAPATTLARALGDCKDKSQLMVAVLKRLGIEAVPVLAVAPSDNFVHDGLPSLFQFNHCIVGILWRGRDRRPGMVVVESPGLGPLRLFDPTLAESTGQDIPVQLEGGVGLPLDPRATGLIRFPESQREENLLETVSRWRLEPDGDLDVRLERRFHGAMRARLESDEGDLVDREELRRDVFREISESCPGLSSLEVGEPAIREDRPWEYTLAYRCPRAAASFGEFEVLDLPRWTGWELFSVPGEKGSDATYQPLLGTFREAYELDPGRRRLLQVPDSFEVENSLGAVRVKMGPAGDRLAVIREVVVSSKEAPLAKKPEILELQRAMRRAGRLSVVLGP